MDFLVYTRFWCIFLFYISFGLVFFVLHMFLFCICFGLVLFVLHMFLFYICFGWNFLFTQDFGVFSCFTLVLGGFTFLFLLISTYM